MAGHSKWANIKHRKAGQDAKRARIFSKLIRELTVAARLGGAEIADNPRLRAVVDKALSANMTKDTIDRAIDRGAGNTENESLEELVYEGYGPNGIAILVEVMTDNKNRTVAELRHAFSKAGGNLGTDGSVAYLFNKTGVISYATGVTEEQLLDAILEADVEADDVISNSDGSIDVHTSFENFGAVKDALDSAGFEASQAEVTMLAATEIELDADGADKLMRLVDSLEDLDDVQNVYSNANIPDDVMAQLDQ